MRFNVFLNSRSALVPWLISVEKKVLLAFLSIMWMLLIRVRETTLVLIFQDFIKNTYWLLLILIFSSKTSEYVFCSHFFLFLKLNLHLFMFMQIDSIVNSSIFVTAHRHQRKPNSWANEIQNCAHTWPSLQTSLSRCRCRIFRCSSFIVLKLSFIEFIIKTIGESGDGNRSIESSLNSKWKRLETVSVIKRWNEEKFVSSRKQKRWKAIEFMEWKSNVFYRHNLVVN